MSTHHAQTALRYLDHAAENATDSDYVQAAGHTAIAHAQLETAAQIERLCDMANELKDEFTLALAAVVGTLHQIKKSFQA